MTIERVPNRTLAHIVGVDGKFYYVDSCYTLDMGYETMAFPCNKKGKVIDWTPVYTNRYKTQEEMEGDHNHVVKFMSKILE